MSSIVPRIFSTIRTNPAINHLEEIGVFKITIFRGRLKRFLECWKNAWINTAEKPSQNSVSIFLQMANLLQLSNDARGEALGIAALPRRAEDTQARRWLARYEKREK